MNVWAAFKRATSDPSDAYVHDIFVGVYATREAALEHCWPKGDGRWVREETVRTA